MYTDRTFVALSSKAVTSSVNMYLDSFPEGEGFHMSLGVVVYSESD